MEAATKKSDFHAGKTLIIISVSFIIAFLLQLVVHEMGHYIAGIIVGATDGQVFLHPFNNSKVVFGYTPEMPGEIIVGISGILLDLLLATTIGILFWKKRNMVYLPLLMWGSIAYIGEGIGMISSVAVYPGYIEDITQLFRIGVPASMIIVVSILFVIVGLVWMILVIQMSGVAEKESFIKRFLAYFCSLPLYFILCIIYIILFSPQDTDILQVRTMQLMISIVLAFLMTIFHKLIIRIMKAIRLTKVTGTTSWSDVIFLSLTAIICLVSMLGYSNLID